MQCFQTNGQKIFICYNFKMANLMFFSCKDNNQKSLDNLSGTWQVKQITFSQTGSINPDNISIIIFQLDNFVGSPAPTQAATTNYCILSLKGQRR